MIIKIDDKEIHIDEATQYVAQGIADDIIDNIKQDDTHEAIFYTILLAIYRKSVEMLNACGSDELKRILEEYYELCQNKSVRR